MMRTIDVETLRAWLEEGRPVTVLDIRPTSERAEWAIPGSIHIDAYNALKANDPKALADVALPGDAPVVTVCAAGKTSLIAAELLCTRGIQAFSLDGGMKAWSLAWNTAEVSLPGNEAHVIQVRRTGKGCLSYLIGSDGLAAVIDPSLPAEVYLDLVQTHGWRISLVLETHIHADHLSRARDIAQRSYATLLLPDQRRASYPFTPVHDGEHIPLGAIHLTALHTPGHTPESTCYLLEGKALFTGDTLFLDAVGRPDLHASTDEVTERRVRIYPARARLLYRSLQRLLQLPAETVILPGHSSRPVAFDHTPIAAPLAEVQERLGSLPATEDAFIASVLARIPPTPPNYERIIAYNEVGQLPEQDVTELEAGANRCAIA
jgi:glyoxylase-like metal-dependent hydrolase (beta-lactamase superfamily II)